MFPPTLTACIAAHGSIFRPLRQALFIAASSWLLVNSSIFAADETGKTPKSNSPDWARDVVWYQIFPERFRNGDPSNDPVRASLDFPIMPGTDWQISRWTADWYARDAWEKAMGPDFYKDGVFERRYGGDLQGVIDKLDYIQSLGVTALYFNPLFDSHSLHKYDGNSYHHIDPYFGPDPKGDIAMMSQETSDSKTWKWTAADKLFLDLLAKAHERHLRVIIDGVFNHTGRDFFAFKDLRINQEKSPYKSWYAVEEFDDPATKRVEFKYRGWWGHATLPVFAATDDKTDMAPGPKAYIFEATKRWMDPNGDGNPADGIDGWRLDVADERPPKFWHDWNAHVRSINPDAYTVAEIWKDPAELIRDGGFSASMSYFAFAMPVKGFLIDNVIPPSKFGELLIERRNAFPPEVAAVMQNLVDSHDTDRMASVIVNSGRVKYDDLSGFGFNSHNTPREDSGYMIRKPNARDRKIQRLVALFQMTYVGAPMIYYGTEAGMWSAHDPDDRMPMVWEDLHFDPQASDPRGIQREPDDVNFDPAIFQYYQSVVHLRTGTPVLQHGAFTVLPTPDQGDVFAFLRSDDTDSRIVLFNRSEQEQKVTVSVPAELAAKWPVAGPALTTDAPIAISGENGKFEITLPALSGAVLSPGAAK